MKINKQRTIEEVQADFNGTFPGLNICFSSQKHEMNEASSKSSIYPEEMSLGEIKSNLIEGFVSLDPSKSVQDLESEIETRFGLHVQVMRRSNEVWLQTTATDDWTLAEQNRKGISSTQINQEQ